MNKRLQSYLRSIGLNENATDAEAWEYYSGLRGVQRSIANLLNYVEDDQQARAACDNMLREMGYDPNDPTQVLTQERSDAAPATATRQQADEAANGQRNVADDTGATNADDAVAAERSRQTQIRGLAEVSNVPDEMLRTALDQGHDVERAQADFLRHYREQRGNTVPAGAPAGHVRGQGDYERHALTAAMMLREGTNDPSRIWPERNDSTGALRLHDMSSNAEVERACDRGHELQGLTMLELARRALALDGVECEPTATSIGRAVQIAATRGVVATGNLTGIMTTSFNALLVASYMEAEDTTRGWTSERLVNNYLTNERTRLEAGAGLAKRASGQTAEMGEIDDAQETYKVYEYAKQFVIDEQDLINDRFGALGKFSPDQLGAAAARLRPDLVYSVLLANANMRDSVALFHASHSNLKTGAALGVVTLEAARAAMRIQQENSVNLNIMPKFLIVPGQLESTADTLVESSVVVSGNTTARGENNSNARAGLTVVADARLDNGVTDPNSGTAYSGSASTWFLASAGTGHTIEVGYIREKGTNPTVRSNVLTQGRFGISFDVQHSVGAKAIDWRGLVKNTA